MNVETAQIKKIQNHLPADIGKGSLDTLDWFLDNGMIEVSMAMEQAVAHESGNTVIGGSGWDISDGSEVKSAVVRWHNSGRAYSAPIFNLKNKTGIAKVIIYEPITDQNYHFVIENVVYNQLKHIEIPFDKNGKPKRDNYWWSLEVGSFKQMAVASSGQNKKPVPPVSAAESLDSNFSIL